MIQVFGTKKCRDTQKALRFFKERDVRIQFRDIDEKAPSPGELDDMAGALGGFEALLDLKGRAAAARGLAFMAYDAREELLADPALLRTPLVRAGRGRAAAGPDEKAWKEFAKADLAANKGS
ncbi:glutaredoxin [bacterium]|nr:glutaredoxin [bacterium]